MALRPRSSDSGPPPGGTGAPVGGTGAASGLLGAVIVLWGINWPIMKIGLDYMGPATFAAARMAMATVCAVLLVWALGRLHWPTRRDRRIVLIVGLGQMSGFIVLVNTGLQFVDAGRSAILAYTTPLWVVPAAVLFLGERLTPLRAAGIAVGLCGVLVMFNPLTFDWGDRTALIGNACLMLAAMIWAVQIVLIKGVRADSGPLELAPFQFAVASCVLVPLALVLDAGRPIGWSWELAWILAYNGPLATAFAFYAVVAINTALPAITTSLGMLGVPVAGLICAAILLGEPVGWTKGLGLTFIVGGVLLVVLADRRAAQRPAL